MNVRERNENDLDSVRGLLESAGLPFNGMERTCGWVVEEAGQIVAHIAIEGMPDAVVLRSLATAPVAQGRGYARKLIERAEAEAGVRTLLLRTKTVGPWVVRRGYTLANSDQVPNSVRATSEFEGSLCSGFPIYIKRTSNEITQIVPPRLMTPAVAELAAISAAMASNCEPCFKFHFDKARKLGISREDIRMAVNIGLSVKSAPHRKVIETAERFLGEADLNEPIPTSCCAPEPTKTGCGCNGTASDKEQA